MPKKKKIKEEVVEEVKEEVVEEEVKVEEPKDEIVTIQVCGAKVTGIVGVDANGNKTVTSPDGVTYHA